MANFRTFPPHVVDFVKASRQAQPADAVHSARHADDRMMFPWSIGTTRAAKELVNPRRKEECPPEVYIG